MSVGDGTWDFGKNSFLLPNLQGLNFETMQYNGQPMPQQAAVACVERLFGTHAC